MKKWIAVLLAVGMILSSFLLTSCEQKEGEKKKDDFKLGVILMNDEESAADKDVIDAAQNAAKDLKLAEDQVVLKKNVAADAGYAAAKELAEAGCGVIFAASSDYETDLIRAAKEFKNVQFCLAGGVRAHLEKLSNYHNAYASIYEGRYLAGIAAGMKLCAEMQADPGFVPKMGYVAKMTRAEEISGYTAFYLGAKTLCENVTMEVLFTGKAYDAVAEKEAAAQLVENGCVLIAQSTATDGVSSVCLEKGIANVPAYLSADSASDAFLVTSGIDWAPYLNFVCENAQKGESIPADYVGTLKKGEVVISSVGAAAPTGTQEKVDEYKGQLVGLDEAVLTSGTRDVFETKTFTVTVEGDKNLKATVDEDNILTSYLANVDTDEKYGDTEAVEEGVFRESKFRSAPYFDVQIDGITLLNTK